MDILGEVQGLLQKHFSLAAEQVRPEQNLSELGIDSLGTIEFMFVLEDKFGISLSDQRGRLETVADIGTMVQDTLAAREPT